MTVRIVFLALAMLLSAPAFAGQPGADLQSVGAIPAAFPAAADKVYPPLPSLAMLPPPGAGDDALPLKPATHRKKQRVAAPTQERRSPPTPVVRIVVSDASHAYLDSVQRQIEQALAK
ncbi:hypothetical protein B0G80_6702 [Paraburkholderia sp. BL6669N2]|uniref:hypothetical protein n=1 Tax=unclassified Paraburkholderia TaxID=2615204 RepID=UPI000E395B2D|nr:MULTISPECIES: hypothetical protein [unclassified Paraburkholderia]REG50277.1 hypothetical protein B0G80_6702 [Paraburkholderia sp. BL6669N2]TDY22688.1 hypothetical protein B0G81_3000 [Paraburkholderia sp. BL6665CI2N2]